MKARITRIGTTRDGQPCNFAFDCGGIDSSSFYRTDGKPHIFGWSHDELLEMIP